MESIIPISNLVLIDNFDLSSPHSSFNGFWKYVLEHTEIKTLERYIQFVSCNSKSERSIQLVTFLSAIAQNSSNIILQLYLYNALRKMEHKAPDMFESRLNHRASPLVDTLEFVESSIKARVMETRDIIDSTG